MPCNNGLVSAATAGELTGAMRWAISNPWHSGVQDLFGTYSPIVRPRRERAADEVIARLTASSDSIEKRIDSALRDFLRCQPPLKQEGRLEWLDSFVLLQPGTPTSGVHHSRIPFGLKIRVVWANARALIDDFLL